MEFAENTVECFLAQHQGQKHTLYWWLLLFLIALFISLPFIKVDITVRSTGTLRPVSERVELVFRSSGFIANLPVKDNSLIDKDSIIAVVRSASVEERFQLNEKKKKECSIEIEDLTGLVAADLKTGVAPILRSELWRSSWQTTISQHKGMEVTRQQMRNEAFRSELLFKEKLVPLAELETHQFQLQKAEADVENLERNTLGQWRAELTRNERMLRDLESEGQQIREEMNLGLIRSPAEGSILFSPGLAVGTFVSPGGRLGTVSPIDGLIAEAYVFPKDVVQLKKGQRARLQIDGYAYTEWGILPGIISEVGSDMIVMNNQPAFKVLVKLENTKLTLANGISGEVKKGMTCQVRFPINRRSLLQLLYENSSQWFNPGSAPPQKQTLPQAFLSVPVSSTGAFTET
jgi:HlyD family secretion protein